MVEKRALDPITDKPIRLEGATGGLGLDWQEWWGRREGQRQNQGAWCQAKGGT